MPLINTIQQPTALSRVKALSTGLLIQMKSVAKQQFDLVWKNRQSTAQQFFDTLGVESSQALEAHYNLQMLILSLDNTWVPLVPPLPYVVNVDGTITVTYPAPEPIPEPQGEQP